MSALPTAFKTEAKKQGIEIVADEAWDAKQPNYTALFEGFKASDPDCVFLGGINDNNGEQLIRGQGCSTRPERRHRQADRSRRLHRLPDRPEVGRSAGMYISFAGLPARSWSRPAAPVRSSSTDFKAKYGHDPASAYAIYGAAAAQYIMAAIAASDGTRKGVRDAAFSGKITIPADQSVIGKEFSIDSTVGRRERPRHVHPAVEGQRRDVPEAVACRLIRLH